MLINPLKAGGEEIKIEISGDGVNKAAGDIIGYLIDNYSDLLSDVQVRAESSKMVEKIVREKMSKDYIHINADFNESVKKIMDRLFGYHVLQKYIEDKTVSDIRTIAWDAIYIKKKGKWIYTGESFLNKGDYSNFVRYCILKNNGKITEEEPVAIVSDKINKLRIEAGIPPVNIGAPNLVIRIHRPEFFTSLDDLYTGESFMMDLEIYQFLLRAVTAGCNIIISGKGGSGKTTLLRALIDKIPGDIAITSNEETAELFSTHPNIIQRQILKNRNEHKNITLEKLTAQSLVMTNDAIVVGELKGEEAMVLFDAVSTGHRAYATVHSDSADMSLDRLVTLMKRDPQAQQYSDRYLKEILAESIDIIIYMKNFKIQEISEIVFNKQSRTIGYNTLFKFEINEVGNSDIKGVFKKIEKPKQKVKDKLQLTAKEFERLYGGEKAD